MTRLVSRMPVMSASRLCAALIAAAMLSACASGNAIEAGVPANPDGTPAGAVDTGTYPNLNIPPRRAASQLSDAEKTASTNELVAARKDHASSSKGAAPDESAELRRLGKTHARDTLRAIEASN